MATKTSKKGGKGRGNAKLAKAVAREVASRRPAAKRPAPAKPAAAKAPAPAPAAPAPAPAPVNEKDLIRVIPAAEMGREIEAHRMKLEIVGKFDSVEAVSAKFREMKVTQIAYEPGVEGVIVVEYPNPPRYWAAKLTRKPAPPAPARKARAGRGAGAGAARTNVLGYSPTPLLRWMGGAGFTTKQAVAALAKHGVTLSPGTISFQIGLGKRNDGSRGEPANVTKAHGDILREDAGMV